MQDVQGVQSDCFVLQSSCNTDGLHLLCFVPHLSSNAHFSTTWTSSRLDHQSPLTASTIARSTGESPFQHMPMSSADMKRLCEKFMMLAETAKRCVFQWCYNCQYCHLTAAGRKAYHCRPDLCLRCFRYSSKINSHFLPCHITLCSLLGKTEEACLCSASNNFPKQNFGKTDTQLITLSAWKFALNTFIYIPLDNFLQLSSLKLLCASANCKVLFPVNQKLHCGPCILYYSPAFKVCLSNAVFLFTEIS